MEKNPTTLFVVAAALTNESGAILLQKRPDHATMGGLWEFPGGKVEAGETPDAALARELFEELGISVNPQDLIPETFASEPLGDRHLLLLLYRCVKWKGTVTPHFAQLKMRFTAPTGFGIQNGNDAVSINGNTGKAMFTAAAFDGNRDAYISNAFQSVAGKNMVIPVRDIRRTTVNGIPAFYARSVVNTQQGQRAVSVFAYEWSPGTAFHFVTITAANARPFEGMFESMSRLNNAQAAEVKPRTLRVVTVGRTDTVASLATRMAYPSLQTERFLALNGLTFHAALRPGQKVKIVTY